MRLNFKLNGYLSRQYLWTLRWGNSYTRTSPLEVIIQSNFVADFSRLFEPPFWELRGNVRTPSIAHWKARCRFSIRHNSIVFAFSCGLDVINGNLSKSGVFRRGWVTVSANFRRKRASPTNQCWCQKTRVIALSCQNIRSALSGFVTKHACVRRTDGQNYDSQDRASIAASSGNNTCKLTQ